MASIEHRPGKNGDAWRVVWRQDGKKQSETFYSVAARDEFRGQVEAFGNRWPPTWTPGVGYAAATADAGPTFREYAEQTIDARGKADVGTRRTYKRMLANHVYDVIGATPIATLTRLDVAKVSQRMVDAGRSQKTVSNVHALVSSILKDAVADRLIDRNPAVGAMPRMPTTKTEEMCFLSRGEFALIVEHIDGEQNKQLARFLAGTGLRWSEATALQVWDVDLLGRSAFDVRRAWKRRDAMFELGGPKTVRSRRSIPISHEIREILIPLVAAKQPTDFVFTAPEGGEIRHANWYHRVWVPALIAARHCDTHRQAALDELRAWRNAKRRASKRGDRFTDVKPAVKGCNCAGVLTKTPRIHDLRHSHASWLLADKITLPAIQRRLGHESIQTTIDRYSHLAPEHADEINASVDRVLGRRLPARTV